LSFISGIIQLFEGVLSLTCIVPLCEITSILGGRAPGAGETCIAPPSPGGICDKGDRPGGRKQETGDRRQKVPKGDQKETGSCKACSPGGIVDKLAR